ncbi:hypothetical protein CPC08DRAFT_754541 [Agrocybe pediades]|nr:hypothetical protein CPC08DRAFT_754541 [Agrocybe pediades]
MSPPTPLFHNILTRIYWAIQYERYGHLAAGSIALYDYVITFGQEVELIWLERWSVVKVLFLANRYYALTSVIWDYYGIFDLAASTKVRPICESFSIWQGVTNIAVNALAQGILQLRIYALYPDNKRVLGLMVSTFVASIAASSALSWRQIIPALSEGAQAGGQLCTVELPPFKFKQLVWVPMLIFETLLFFLACVKGYQNFDRKPFGPFLFHRSCQRLADVLFRDSVIYFAAIGATHITCFLVWLFLPDFTITPMAFSVVIPCILANRLVLNLRATARARAELLMNIDGETEEVLRSNSQERVTGPITFAKPTSEDS